MLLLDETDSRILKQELETTGDCCTHARKNYGSLLRILCKDIKSKKSVSGGIHYKICGQLRLKNHCGAKGLALDLHSLKAAEDRNAKDNE